MKAEDIKLIVEGKVDSRVKGSNQTQKKTHITGKYERTYCVVCMQPKGWVTKECYEFIQAEHIIVVCNDCEAGMGEAPLQKVPDELIHEVD